MEVKNKMTQRKQFDWEEIGEEACDRIASNPKLFRSHVEKHIGGLESSMIDRFYEATSKHPEKIYHGDTDHVDFAYKGPLFGIDRAELKVVVNASQGYDVLERPELGLVAYDTGKRLYLDNKGKIDISQDNSKNLTGEELKKSWYFEGKVLDLFERTINMAKE